MAGPLMAAGPVIVIAASFTNAIYEKLPIEELDDEEMNANNDEEMGLEKQSGDGDNSNGNNSASQARAVGESVYNLIPNNSQISHDVFWGPLHPPPPSY